MYSFVFEFAEADEASAKALTSLYRWLRDDSATRNYAKVELVSEADPGEMGSIEVLCAVLGQLTSIGSLAVAFASWRDSRTTTPNVRIRHGQSSIDIEDATAEQLAMAMSALAEATV